MFFFFVRSFTATAQAEIWRHVTCEHCKSDFVYLLRLNVQHSESSFYGVRDEAARAQAPVGAQARLEYLARNANELVACPDCGYFQSDMCEEIRKRKFGWMRTAGFFCLCGCIASIAPLLEQFNTHEPQTLTEFYPYYYATALLFVLFMAALFVGQSLLWRNHNPNSVADVLKRQSYPDDKAIPIARFRTEHPDAQLIRKSDG